MIVRVLGPARAEIDDAILWYETQRTGLGQEFLDEVLDSLQTIQNHPKAWQAVDATARRFILSRFPFSIVFEFDTGDLIVIAVAHH